MILLGINNASWQGLMILVFILLFVAVGYIILVGRVVYIVVTTISKKLAKNRIKRETTTKAK